MMGERSVAEETAVAFTYNGSAHAVMMATPADLEDFAIGLSLTEGIIQRADEISDLEVINCEDGVELRIWIAEDRMRPYATRRRHLAGPTGCELCGIESLSEAALIAACRWRRARADRARNMCGDGGVAGVTGDQPRDRAVHAAAFWRQRQETSRSARTSAATRVRTYRLARPPGREGEGWSSSFSPAGCRLRWCGRLLSSALQSWLRCPLRRRSPSALRKHAG